MMFINGNEVRDKLQANLCLVVSSLVTKPLLVIIQVGNREDSNTYIAQKKLFAEKIGVTVIHKQFSEETPEEKIQEAIQGYNTDSSVHGIIVQIPLPASISKNNIIESITPEKDVDGLTSTNIKKLYDNDPSGYISATAKGIVTLLKAYEIPLSGKRVVIVGRSGLVGKATALALLHEDATVTICHSKTENLAGETKRADILIVATGHPKLITKEHVSKGQVIIDVGISRADGKLVGDVDTDAVKDSVYAISPVPGGVGPLTVASLFENLIAAYEICIKKLHL